MASWVIVDNSDLAINYTGPWISTNVTNSNNDTSSETGIDLTAHIAAPSSFIASDFISSFFFAFNGTKLAVFGLDALFNETLRQTPQFNLPIPAYECILDNQSITTNNPYEHYPLQSYCETGELVDGFHTFEFRVTNATGGLWFDYLRYMPSLSDGVPAGSVAWYGAADIVLPFESKSKWAPIGSGIMTENMTLSDLAFIMFYFGGSLTWYGLSKAAIELASVAGSPTISPNLSVPINQGYYQVDNGPLTQFQVDLSQQPVAAELNPYTTILFTTPATFIGKHNITVAYDRQSSTVWPLTLDFITVEGGFDDRGAQLANDASISRKVRKQGVIAGAVVGVLAGILVIALGLYILRYLRVRRRLQHRNNFAAHLARNGIKLRPFTRTINLELENVKGDTQLVSSTR